MSLRDLAEMARRQDELVAKMARDIVEDGWAVVQVGWGPNGEPGVAYTVGLTEHGQPEVEVRALPVEVGYDVLEELARRVWCGARLFPGMVLHSIFEGGYKGALVEAPGNDANWNARLYGYGGYEVLRLVFQDQHRRWPWHSEHEGFRHLMMDGAVVPEHLL